MGRVNTTKLLNRLEEIERELKPPFIDITVNNDNSIEFHRTGLIYKPSNTHKLFHEEDAECRVVMGAFGSGKTTAMIAEMILRSVKMPKCKDGIRRCKWVIIRNTFLNLKRTVLKSCDSWLSNLDPNYKKRDNPDIVRQYKFCDGHGRIILDLEFLSIDNKERVDQLRSLNGTYVWLCELSTLYEVVLQECLGRLGRYPEMHMIPEKDRNYFCGLISETNAPKTKHWVEEIENTTVNEYNEKQIVKNVTTYDYSIGNDKKTIKMSFYHQPPALLEEEKGKWVANVGFAENIENLAGGFSYYFKMLLKNDNDYIRMYAQGKYGVLPEGKKVFNRYNDDLHSVETIEVEDNIDILYGIDYGRIAPAILVCQYVAGQLRCIKEFCGSHIYISELASEMFIPWLQKNVKEGVAIYGIDDPAQTDDGRKQLRNLDLNVRGSLTNKIDVRLASVNNLLGRITSNGKPSLLISRRGCPNLREGFNGMYVLEEVKVHGEPYFKDKPNKSHPYSDIQDALQYITLEFYNSSSNEELEPIYSRGNNLWM